MISLCINCYAETIERRPGDFFCFNCGLEETYD
jgi:hypothetical protein